jgi:hypothetical protein
VAAPDGIGVVQGRQTGTHPVLTVICNFGISWRHATNSESSTWGTCLLRPEPISREDAYFPRLWGWGSQWSRVHGEAAIRALLSPWPVDQPANWTARVNAPLTAKELDRVRVSIERGRPYGGDEWVRQTVQKRVSVSFLME